MENRAYLPKGELVERGEGKSFVLPMDLDTADISGSPDSAYIRGTGLERNAFGKVLTSDMIDILAEDVKSDLKTHAIVHNARLTEDGQPQTFVVVPYREDITAGNLDADVTPSERFDIGVAFQTLNDKHARAVKVGDMEKAQELTDEAARLAGFNYIVYHATQAFKFAGNAFSKVALGSNTGSKDSKRGFFFAVRKEMAESYLREGPLSANEEALKKLSKWVELATSRIRKLAKDKGINADFIPFRLTAKPKDSDVTHSQVQDEVRGDLHTFAREVAERGEGSSTIYSRLLSIIEEARQETIVSLPKKDRLINAYLKVTNPMIDEEGGTWDEQRYDEVLSEAQRKGHDGVIFKNINDSAFAISEGGLEADKGDVIVVFEPNQIKGRFPVTYYADGKTPVPLGKRFDQSTDDIAFQINDAENRTILNQRKSNRLKGSAAKLEFLAKLRKNLEKLDAKLSKLKPEPADDEDKNRRKVREIRESLAMLDAIVSALPKAIRAEVGGHTRLANLNTPEARLKYLEGRMKRAQVAINKEARRRFKESFKNLIDRSKAIVQPGKKDMGKLGAEIHAIFQEVESASKLPPEDVASRVKYWEDLLAQRLSEGDLEPEAQAKLELTAQLVNDFGAFNSLTADAQEHALLNGWRVFQEAYQQAKEIKDARSKAIKSVIRRLVGDTGNIDANETRKRVDEMRAKNPSFWRTIMLEMTDFNQFLGYLFGDSSLQAREFGNREREAHNQKQDGINRIQDAFNEFFTKLADGDSIKGLQTLHDLKTTRVTVKGDGVERVMSQGEMMHWLMMYEQEDGKLALQGYPDADGKPTMDWHYGDEFFNDLKRKLDPNAKAAITFLREQYSAEWESLNKQHEALFLVSLPQIKNYSPITKTPANVSQNEMVDPITNEPTMVYGSTPSFLRRRAAKSNAEPSMRDAFEIFQSHTIMAEHWKAYAPLVRDLQAVMGDRTLRAAIEANAGKEGTNALTGWLDFFRNGGVRDATMNMQMSRWIRGATSRAAQIALAGRISVLVIQATQIGAATAHMSPLSFIKRFTKLLAGELDESFLEAWKSDFIQRRIKDLPPSVRLAMERTIRDRPKHHKNWLEQELPRLISLSDGFFTTITYAIIYDYQRTKKGLSPDKARAEADRLTEQVAQPVRPGTRSLYENRVSNNTYARLGWAFASEARQKIMLSAYAFAKQGGFTTVEFWRAVGVTWGLNGAMAAVIRAALQDLKDEDDDEAFDRKHWNPVKLGLQTLAGPFYGIPYAGELAEAALWDGLNKAGFDVGFRPEGDLLSGVTRIPGATYDLLTGESFEDIDELTKDVDVLLNGLGIAFQPFVAYATATNFLRDLYRIYDNVD